MSDFWTLEGMYGSGKKDKKHGKQKKYEEKEKEKKKKKKHHDDSDNGKHDKKSKLFGETKKSSDNEFIPYAEFLKHEKEGLFIVRVTIDDVKLETYILKDDNFDFPRVALNKSHDSYKDWLRKKLENSGSEISINKVLYSSMVKPLDIPKGLLSKIINLSKDGDE